MMFSEHDDGPNAPHTRRSHTVRIVRDVIEIVAIVAAGFWAFYVFIYENRILPSLARPNINFSASLEKEGAHGGLIAIRLHRTIKNVGTVHVHFLGLADTVVGQRIELLSAPRRIAIGSDTLRPAAYYRASQAVPVYSTGFITHLADPKTEGDLYLDPGEQVENDSVFYVPQNRYDRLVVVQLARYTRYEDRPIPTSFALDEQGLPKFANEHDDSVSQFATDTASLDLHGR
ncbi:MAG: hypothetical protein JOZ38_00465 [Candidatus Eremiobacteraeota bacterium]|nr:hypothetical protein [Candidatus Eremiobacteraeota bacterium]